MSHGFHHSPAPLGDRKQSWMTQVESIHSHRRNDHDHILWPILLSHRHQDTYWTHFSQDTCLPNILTQKWHFSDTQIRRRLILFETCHILARSGSWWFPSCFTFKWSFRWNHEFDVVLTLPDEAEGWWFPNYLYRRCESANSGDGKCIYHFTPLAQRTVGYFVFYWLSLM